MMPAFDDIMHVLSHAADEDAVCRALLALGAAGVRDIVEIEGANLLHALAERGMARALALVLQTGVAPDGFDADGRTALHVAVLADQAQAADVLLQAGADMRLRVGRTLQKDMTALHLAALSTPAVLASVVAHADRDALADTVEVETGCDDVLRLVLVQEKPDMLAVLLAHGLSANGRGDDGHSAAQYVLLHHKSSPGAVENLRLLHAYGADLLRDVNGSGENLLHLAARAGIVPAFDFLMSIGVTPAVTHDGSTLLHAAAVNFRPAIMQAALGFGIDVNAQNRHGTTALHLAALRNRLDQVKLLIDAGADPWRCDNNGRTPDKVCQSPAQRLTHAFVLAAQRQAKKDTKKQKPVFPRHKAGRRTTAFDASKRRRNRGY